MYLGLQGIRTPNLGGVLYHLFTDQGMVLYLLTSFHNIAPHFPHVSLQMLKDLNWSHLLDC